MVEYSYILLLAFVSVLVFIHEAEEHFSSPRTILSSAVNALHENYLFNIFHNSKEFCSRGEGNDVACIPTVYLIGASKCGTSSLSKYLESHQLAQTGTVVKPVLDSQRNGIRASDVELSR